jgi:transcriptional regulator of met regulon
MGLKELVNKRITKSIKFMGEDIKISKLTVAEITIIREQAKIAKDSTNDADNLEILKQIVVKSVEGGETLTDDDFQNFPMDDLSKLSNEIMKYSGLDTTPAAGEKGK